MMRHTSLSNEIPALYHNIAKAIGFIDERSSVIMEEPVDIDVVIVIVNVVVVVPGRVIVQWLNYDMLLDFIKNEKISSVLDAILR